MSQIALKILTTASGENPTHPYVSGGKSKKGSKKSIIDMIKQITKTIITLPKQIYDTLQMTGGPSDTITKFKPKNGISFPKQHDV